MKTMIDYGFSERKPDPQPTTYGISLSKPELADILKAHFRREGVDIPDDSKCYIYADAGRDWNFRFNVDVWPSSN